MKKLLIFFVLTILMAGTAGVSTAANNKPVVGEWKYQVPQRPTVTKKASLYYRKRRETGR
jgi:hypothetical protein